MSKIVLEKRELKGKKCKQLVKKGIIPCVIYNIKKESKMCQIEKGLAERLLRGVTSSTMLDVEYDGKEMKILVKDVDTNPKTDLMRHISFFEIDENAKLTFDIPFVLVDISPAVKNNLGVLIQTTNSITVKCKSKDLVPQFEVSLTTLENAGDAILVKDVKIPEGIEVINQEEVQNYTIATITEIQKQEEIVAEEETEGDEAKEEAEEGGEEQAKE